MVDLTDLQHGSIHNQDPFELIVQPTHLQAADAKGIGIKQMCCLDDH